MGFDTSEEFRAILAIYEIRGVVEFTIRLSSNKLEYDLALFYTTAMQKKLHVGLGRQPFLGRKEDIKGEENVRIHR